ncbi:MAG: glycosyltransferase family 4 protein, partial [Nitrospina sp.]|nr:glycosyltransferase family 4 protein [Nitrospina sp.]
TLSRSIKHLIWFFPYSFFKALYLIRKHSVQHVHLCDGLLSPVGVLLKFLTGAKVTVTIHGLDITYPRPLYQMFIPRCVTKLDGVVCVSHSTHDECVRRVIPCPNCTVIPNGIRPNQLYREQPINELRRKLESLIGISIKNKKTLFTIGHLVKRKGVAWFVKNVMPRLEDSCLYVVAGEGPERGKIQAVVDQYNLQGCVLLSGEISDEDRRLIYNASDIFIMPNITVPGDVEGFGIVALEAGSCGLPVVASDIQGLRDAVIDGKTGYLVEEGNVEGFVGKITDMNLKKDQIRKIVNSTFDWAKIYKDYRIFLFT